MICERRIATRAKGKIYQIAVKTAMMYSLQTVALTKRQGAKLEVTELMILTILFRVGRRDRIRNEFIRGRAQVD